MVPDIQYMMVPNSYHHIAHNDHHHVNRDIDIWYHKYLDLSMPHLLNNNNDRALHIWLVTSPNNLCILAIPHLKNLYWYKRMDHDYLTYQQLRYIELIQYTMHMHLCPTVFHHHQYQHNYNLQEHSTYLCGTVRA
jgi:hypothetical protein